MVQNLVQNNRRYLLLRSATYYFRFLTPTHVRRLVPSLPREVKRSLKTNSLLQARALVGQKLPLIRLIYQCFDKRTLTGREYILVREEKTRTANRQVPVHCTLKDQGLLDYAATAEGYMFPTALGNLNRVTDLFGFLIDEPVNDFSERLVFYSIRHSFITKARSKGISDPLIQQVVGHEKRGAGITDRYTHTFPLADVFQVVNGITY